MVPCSLPRFQRSRLRTSYSACQYLPVCAQSECAYGRFLLLSDQSVIPSLTPPRALFWHLSAHQMRTVQMLFAHSGKLLFCLPHVSSQNVLSPTPCQFPCTHPRQFPHP